MSIIAPKPELTPLIYNCRMLLSSWDKSYRDTPKQFQWDNTKLVFILVVW